VQQGHVLGIAWFIGLRDLRGGQVPGDHWQRRRSRLCSVWHWQIFNSEWGDSCSHVQQLRTGQGFGAAWCDVRNGVFIVCGWQVHEFNVGVCML